MYVCVKILFHTMYSFLYADFVTYYHIKHFPISLNVL